MRIEIGARLACVFRIAQVKATFRNLDKWLRRLSTTAVPATVFTELLNRPIIARIFFHPARITRRETSHAESQRRQGSYQRSPDRWPSSPPRSRCHRSRCHRSPVRCQQPRRARGHELRVSDSRYATPSTPRDRNAVLRRSSAAALSMQRRITSCTILGDCQAPDLRVPLVA